jgi:hypothetical protein
MRKPLAHLGKSAAFKKALVIPHLHSGIGIRDLSPKGSRLRVYECRLGRALRLIFTLERPSLLYFHMIGTHDDVRRYLKSFL